MNAIELRNVSKHFGGVNALNNVSLHVEIGERRVIIGPNGAGKTTLLNIIGGQLTCDNGQILIFGKNVTNLPDYTRVRFGVARSFQIMRLCFNLTVYQNILLSIQAVKPYRFKIFQKRDNYVDLYDEGKILLSEWGLWEKHNVLVRELSYGEQRKVELLMGLASRPKIVLFDEPTSGLTSYDIEHIFKLILQIGENATIIIVEHDMDFVFSIATEITVLHYGEVVAEGDPKEIRSNDRAKEVYLGPTR